MYKCQCSRCGDVFDLNDVTGVGVGSKKSPCCNWRFSILDDNIARFLDDIYLDINNDPRYYIYDRQSRINNRRK